MGSIRAEGIRKVYPGTVALHGVDIEFESGSIHAFIGKNGSGKSTLMKIFAGVEKQSGGKIYLDGKEVSFRDTSEACKKGIATVFQELSLVTSITVGENIFIGRLPKKKSGFVDWELTYLESKKLLDELGIDIDPKTYVFDLTPSQMQMVEIAKAMSYNPRVLQLDEPTSSLSQTEAQALFEVMRNLKKKEVVIIFVTHRLQELWDVADTCTVLRDGEYIGKVLLNQTERRDVLKMMFGEVTIAHRPEDLQVCDEVVLDVRNLSNGRKFHNISFELKKGEVLGIAGMVGAGRTELLRAIQGADPYASGEIYCFGEKIKRHTPEAMKERGIVMIQEDRKRDGIIANDSVLMNITMASIYQLGKGIFVNKKVLGEMYDKQVGMLQIKVASSKSVMSSLSGGNQQKVILGRFLNTNPRIILFDEPTRGIDVATKQQIFKIIWDLSKEGISSIVVSSELEELIDVCTRLIIMRDGELHGEADMKDLTIDSLYLQCMGEKS
jgi:ribose transport system ATP-binding protein